MLLWLSRAFSSFTTAKEPTAFAARTQQRTPCAPRAVTPRRTPSPATPPPGSVRCEEQRLRAWRSRPAAWSLSTCSLSCAPLRRLARATTPRCAICSGAAGRERALRAAAASTACGVSSCSLLTVDAHALLGMGKRAVIEQGSVADMMLLRRPRRCARRAGAVLSLRSVLAGVSTDAVVAIFKVAPAAPSNPRVHYAAVASLCHPRSALQFRIGPFVPSSTSASGPARLCAVA
jgi:hypothetical protein